jgi:hypothetical protein
MHSKEKQESQIENLTPTPIYQITSLVFPQKKKKKKCSFAYPMVNYQGVGTKIIRLSSNLMQMQLERS